MKRYDLAGLMTEGDGGVPVGPFWIDRRTDCHVDPATVYEAAPGMHHGTGAAYGDGHYGASGGSGYDERTLVEPP